MKRIKVRDIKYKDRIVVDTHSNETYIDKVVLNNAVRVGRKFGMDVYVEFAVPVKYEDEVIEAWAFEKPSRGCMGCKK